MFHYLHVFMEVLCQFNRGWTAVDDFIILLRRIKRKGLTSDLRTLYLMIPYCRDVFRGKGERDLSYRLIYAFYQVFPILAIKAIHLLFRVREGLPMVGSWCDIKYFCVFIERNSPWGAKDPLIAIMASIANRNIDVSAKWIPRESHHPDLFSVFARDFTKSHKGILSSVKKGLYRKRVSSSPSSVGFSYWFMGKYVREALHLGTPTCEVLESRWRRLLKTFPHYKTHGLPIVDLDINIPDDVLFNSIGFACLIAEKMGLKRIMLAGVVPIWIDVSRCDGFVGMVRVLWSHCEGRGVSRLGDAIDLVERGFEFIFDRSLIVFIFSERFSFDRHSILSGKCIPVFWNLGIPDDLYMDSDNNFIYMSGYASGLLMPFFDEICVDGFYKYVLEGYCEWCEYFDLFVSNITGFVSTSEVEDNQGLLETLNNPSLGQI